MAESMRIKAVRDICRQNSREIIVAGEEVVVERNLYYMRLVADGEATEAAEADTPEKTTKKLKGGVN